ncbi:metalloregulator ArsR/SmtB family transcription factor [Lysinibacillus capsici]|uniref:ArsR/SmtB family transcription factor n=1 Tax=Lysinibacillus capsici TaxID=2115968 RepID=UPI003F23F34A
MTEKNIDLKIKLIHGFSNKVRLQILECIKETEKTVSQIVEELKGNQSNISQHLACLRGCGIIVGRNEGKYCYYSLRNERIRELLEMFDTVLEDVHSDVACCANHVD